LNEAIISSHFENRIKIPAEVTLNALRKTTLGLYIEELLQPVSCQVSQLAAVEGRKTNVLGTFL
jgi:flagellar motor switch protein FliM